MIINGSFSKMQHGRSFIAVKQYGESRVTDALEHSKFVETNFLPSRSRFRAMAGRMATGCTFPLRTSHSSPCSRRYGSIILLVLFQPFLCLQFTDFYRLNVIQLAHEGGLFHELFTSKLLNILPSEGSVSVPII